MQFRTRWIAALCAAGLVGRADVAAAQVSEVRFSGYTNGCFSPVGGPACTPTFAAGFQPGVSTGGAGSNVLTYYNSTFDEWTVSSFLALGGDPLAGPGNFNNLGAFGLNVAAAGAASRFDGMGFTLGVTFTRPTPLQEQLGGPPVPMVGNSISFTALLRGTVRATSTGGVNVNFGNNAVNFFSVDGDGIPGPSADDGVFSFQLADMNVNPDVQPASVTANIQALGGIFPQGNVVPEPSTYVLMATGLAGVAGMARRRRRA